MAKAAKKAVGEIDCPCCKAPGRVYKSARTDGKLYWLCPCGGHQPLLQPGQDFILSNARMYGPEGEPAPQAETAPPPAAPASARASVPPAPAPARKSSFLDSL